MTSMELREAGRRGGAARAKQTFVIPTRGHPVIRRLAMLLAQRHGQKSEIARDAGVAYKNLALWCKGVSSPSMHNLDAVLNVLGYEIAIVERPKRDDRTPTL